jgi:hypothetical protein
MQSLWCAEEVGRIETSPRHGHRLPRRDHPCQSNLQSPRTVRLALPHRRTRRQRDDAPLPHRTLTGPRALRSSQGGLEAGHPRTMAVDAEAPRRSPEAGRRDSSASRAETRTGGPTSRLKRPDWVATDSDQERLPSLLNRPSSWITGQPLDLDLRAKPRQLATPGRREPVPRPLPR